MIDGMEITHYAMRECGGSLDYDPEDFKPYKVHPHLIGKKISQKGLTSEPIDC